MHFIVRTMAIHPILAFLLHVSACLFFLHIFSAKRDNALEIGLGLQSTVLIYYTLYMCNRLRPLFWVVDQTNYLFIHLLLLSILRIEL